MGQPVPFERAWEREELVAALGTLVGVGDASGVRVVRAPGRVNLIGEHTDYNLGYVLPAAIDLEIRIASVPTDDGGVTLTRLDHGDTLSFSLAGLEPTRASEEWIDYVAGVAWSLGVAGVPLRGLRGVIASDLPVGSGLSSSAALELAAAWTLATAAPPPLGRMDLARAAQRAENEYVGVMCGLMDQFASAHGETDQALLLDCRSFEYRAVPLPQGHHLVALDTRAPHKLTTSQYNVRREQCEAAVAHLRSQGYAVDSLRDVDMALLRDAASELDDVTLRRCEHVIRENERVLATEAALRSGDLETVGRLFAESHASMRDLYEITSPELDAMVEIAVSVPGVIGARMTGGGFGGCTVNLVRDDAVEALRAAVEHEYPRRTGLEPRVYVVQAAEGAGLLED